jgi:hypothetical protein
MKKIVVLLLVALVTMVACSAEPVEVEVTRVVSDVVEVTRVVTEEIEVEGEIVEVTRVVTEEVLLRFPPETRM